MKTEAFFRWIRGLHVSARARLQILELRREVEKIAKKLDLIRELERLTVPKLIIRFLRKIPSIAHHDKEELEDDISKTI